MPTRPQRAPLNCRLSKSPETDENLEQQRARAASWSRSAAGRVAHLQKDARRARREREEPSRFWTNLIALSDEYEQTTPQHRRAVLEGAVRLIVLQPSRTTSPRVDLGRIEIEWRNGETTSATEPVDHE